MSAKSTRTTPRRSKLDTVSNLPSEAEAELITKGYLEFRSAIVRFVGAGLAAVAVKDSLPQGKFMRWSEEYCPEVSHRWITRGMRVGRRLLEIPALLSLAGYEELPETRSPDYIAYARTVSDALIASPTELKRLCGRSKKIADFGMQFTDGKSQRALTLWSTEGSDSETEEECRAKCEEELTSDPEDTESLAIWDDISERVYGGEISWSRAWAGLRGQQAVKGKPKGPTREFHEKLKSALNIARRGFKEWASASPQDQVASRREFFRLIRETPPDVLSDALEDLQAWQSSRKTPKKTR